jgi:hypothetical protein
MLAQIVLTPAESKKLIAKAVLQLPEVRNALGQGIVAIHPSSSTFFMYEEILGRRPQGVWVVAAITPSGLTYSREAVETRAESGSGPPDPLMSQRAWFFKNGILQDSTPLGAILDQMGEGDVYIKGCNALDTSGKVGVLFANPAGGGGTIGKVMSLRRQKNFHLILPIGLEKLIPVSIEEASHKAGFRDIDKPMGLRCGLIPVRGKKIDETDALFQLSGAIATPIAAGGLGGAEGAVVLACEGDEKQIDKIVEIVQSVKGAELPALHLPAQEGKINN